MENYIWGNDNETRTFERVWHYDIKNLSSIDFIIVPSVRDSRVTARFQYYETEEIVNPGSSKFFWR